VSLFYFYPWTIPPAPIPIAAAPPAVSDLEIRDRIASELFWSPFIDRDRVEIVVEDGVATLRGTVDSWREYHAATGNAYEGGATAVRNRLVVPMRERQ
jgi:osmotically-inducible protein OsmY